MQPKRKSSSPLVDALRLFFRNPSAVVSLILILSLATAATTGKLFTGKEPTQAQLDLMEEAEELGDTVDLDVNPQSVMDPNKTSLKDKFLTPFSDSKDDLDRLRELAFQSTPSAEQTDALRKELEELSAAELGKRIRELTPPDKKDVEFEARLTSMEPKNYRLGTDHLGRDVLAQLWAGSSISLTIGFLAVGISVLLGVSLGGIAGFFGRQSVRLPMMVMLLSALIGGIAIPAEAPIAGVVFLSIAGVAFAYQLVVALIGKRFKPVIAFGVVAALVAAIFGFNSYVESTTPEGRILQEARAMEHESKDVLLMTRDLGRERKMFENGEASAKPAEWFNEHQLRLDVAYRSLRLSEAQYKLVEYLTELEKSERLGHENLERAEHLRNHLDDRYLTEMDEAAEQALSEDEGKLRTRHKARKEKAESLEKEGKALVARANAIRDAIAPQAEAAAAAIEAERTMMEFADDFDFTNAEARVRKLLETELALKRVDRATVMIKYVETLAAALKQEGVQPVALGEPLRNVLAKEETALKERINDLDAAIKSGQPADEATRRGLNDQLASAKLELERVAAAIPFAEGLKTPGADAGAQFDALVQASVGFEPKDEGIRAHLAAAIAEAAKALAKVSDELRDKRNEADEPVIEAIARQIAELEAAGAHATQLSAASEDIRNAEQIVARRLEWLHKPDAELTKEQREELARLKDFDYTAAAQQEGKVRDAYFFTVEPNVVLLNRRADLRTTYLKAYEADAKNRFEDSGGLLESKLLNGAYRYGTYRLTRHFITITIAILALLVVALFAAAAAQGAAEDIKGPLSKVFIPTISVDDVVMRFTEIMLTIPVIYLILAVLALFKKDVYIVMAVIGLTSWMGTTRFVRAEILSLREQDFIQAARALGVGDFRIIWRHLVPNAISPVLVSATIGVAGAVLAESTLSFLGIGAGPDQPTWGQILSNGRAYITDAPWLTWIPGIAILITVLSFNLLGEGLREAFNPKLRGR
jgi:peptide/nickel transport system permease protein